MKLLFAGSTRDIKHEERRAFEQAGFQLGQVAARRGHDILIESEKPNTLDWHVAEGVRAESELLETRPRIELHRMVTQPQAFRSGIGPRVSLTEITYKAEHDERFRRLGARVGGVASSDAVVLMGGANGTRLIGELALDLHKAAIPVAAFGGAAHEFLQQHSALLFARVDSGSWLRHLRHWTDESAARVIDAAQVLSGAHTYFLSYSRDDAEGADHVEVLLRRKRRVFHRDESLLAPGDYLKTRLKGDIAASDTFLILWSAAAAVSEWCRWELETATALLESGNRPRRLLFAMLDGTEPPDDWAERVYLSASTRLERESAIQNITDHEATVGSGWSQ